jgi:hypothetical protein
MTNKSEGMKGLNDAALIAELLGSTVFEKCEYVWSAPYSAEESREICQELFASGMFFSN